MAALATERAAASFDVATMMHFLDGGAHVTALHTRGMTLLADWVSQAPRPVAVSVAEARAQTRAHVTEFYELLVEHGMDLAVRKAIVRAMSLYDMAWYVRSGVHFGLFLSAITSQGTKEQQNEWLPQVLMKEIYGCFAMTELGHGSAVTAVETTATYDDSTREFVIDSPTPTATKWMIGAVAESATHAAVYAQLLVHGESKGLHVFVVPIRDVATHAVLPRIALGDCGVKMGLNGVDNGWLRFDKVRIPHSHLLARRASISPSGTYTPHAAAAAKPSAALIASRGELVMLSINMLKKALTIAVRYGVVRRQGHPDAAGLETRLLDYPTHQARLAPALATAYAYHCQGAYIEALIDAVDTDEGEIAAVHGTMAGLKAFATWDTLAAIETCRQCCGGNGYLACNGLAPMAADFSVMVTFEGDNTVMAHQTGLFVCKAYAAHLAGSAEPAFPYFRPAAGMTWQPTTPAEITTIDALRDLVHWYAATKLVCVYELSTQATAANETAPFTSQVEWVDMAKVHVFYTVAVRFMDTIVLLQRTQSLLAPVLSRLAAIYVLTRMHLDGGFLLSGRYVTPAQFALITSLLPTLFQAVRPDMVPLVDAFNLHDVVLQSCIGRYDGDVYTATLARL